MPTTHELRALYVLKKLDNRAKHSQLSHSMHRVSAQDRNRALANLELLELISSAKTPAPQGYKGGPSGLVYWLTDAGKEYVQDMIDSGEMPDPVNEPRAGKGKKNAHD